MKKTLSLVLSIVVTLSFAACRKTENKTQQTQDTKALSQVTKSAVETKATVSKGEKVDNKEWDDLEALGKIETQNGISSVAIKIPADMTKGITDENLKSSEGKRYISAKRNPDGSITYRMSKKQHKEMLDEMKKSIEKYMKDLVDDDKFSINEITHNDNFTKFIVKLSGEELNINDSLSTLTFYMVGGMYSLFSGKEKENITVEYYNSKGKLVDTANSKDKR